ncbi:MAG TPA: DUF6600 domain-containing protein [Reyranella sp.]|nr:DUF6600 domain-containing protein [Reyranella sp.]
MRRSFGLAVALIAGLASAIAYAQAPGAGDPPGRVGRLAFIEGAVSFHDAQQSDWSPAVANTPLTTGDAVWTEPNARSEISIAGTRVRMDGASELDMLAIDDTQTRMQLDQGRIDIKTFTYDTRQPYTITTPRGLITLEQQGDYYILAGSTQDPTELGVRSGAAQIQAANGQVLAVRAGEIGVISGDDASPQLQTMHQAPPPMPSYWAQRDREVSYDVPQYLSADVTGYEDMSYYGTWQADPEYGEVWIPRSVPAGWAPYRTGHWAYIAPWGWTWVDDQPWGFAPYHYGRWAERGGRWMWVAPLREDRPVYAPALVAFVGGAGLGVALGVQSAQPVGWFPLGPREAYVPPYTHDRDYYRRLNLSARVDQRVLDDRWQRAERHEALRADEHNEQLMNRRFATVVPAQAFTRSEPVQRVALKVDPQKMNAVAVAPVSAPPSPRADFRANAQAHPQPGQAPNQAQRPATPSNNAAIETIGRPTGAEIQHHPAPGPKFAAHTSPTGNVQGGKPNLPQLAPRNPNAPQPRHLQGQQAPAQNQQQHPQAERTPQQPALGGQARPGEPQHLPPVRSPQAERPAEPPRMNNEAQRPNEPARSNEPAREPQRPAENRAPGSPPQHVQPQQAPHQAETPRPQAQPPVQHQEQAHAPAPPPQQHAAPPMPQHQEQAHAPAPPPQQHVAPPMPQHQEQAHAPAPPPQQHMAPPPQQHAAPPMPQHQEQAHAPAPPPQHSAPPPQQHAAPAPQQHSAPPPQQHQQAQHEEEKKK